MLKPRVIDSTGRNLERDIAIKRKDNILTTPELFPH